MREARGKVTKPLASGDIVLIKGMAQPGEGKRLGEVLTIHRTSATVITRKDSTTTTNRFKFNDHVFI